MNSYVSLEHSNNSFKDFFVVNWTFFNVCNFSCSYCVPYLYDGTMKGVELSQVKKFIDKIFEAKKDKKIFFEFTGGEITFYPHFKELFAYIKDRGGFSGIISNGSRTQEWWQEHTHLIDHVCLSFHSEKGKADHFYNVVSQIYGKLTLHVNIMMLPEKFDELLSLGSKIASTVQGVSVSLQPLFDKFSGPMFSYTEEQLEILKDPKLKYGDDILFPLPSGFEHKVFRGEMRKVFKDGTSETANPTLLISNQENRWFGWDCMAGVENLVVGMDGSVMRGICRIGGLLGFIQDPEFALPTEPIVCMKRKCTCAFDIMSSKRI